MFSPCVAGFYAHGVHATVQSLKHANSLDRIPCASLFQNAFDNDGKHDNLDRHGCCTSTCALRYDVAVACRCRRRHVVIQERHKPFAGLLWQVCNVFVRHPRIQERGENDIHYKEKDDELRHTLQHL